MRRSLFLFSLILLFSCQTRSSWPDDVIKPDKMKLVMWDMVRADVYAQDIRNSQTAENDTAAYMKCRELIFSHHHITRGQFIKSYQYYRSHSDIMKNLLDSITAMQQKKAFVPFNQN